MSCDGSCELSPQSLHDLLIVRNPVPQSGNVLMNHSRIQRRARSTYFLTLTSILRGTETAKDRPLALLCVVEERARCMTLISLANRSTFARVGSPYPLVQLKMEAVGENLARRFGLQSEQMTANRLLHHRGGAVTSFPKRRSHQPWSRWQALASLVFTHLHGDLYFVMQISMSSHRSL